MALMLPGALQSPTRITFSSWAPVGTAPSRAMDRTTRTAAMKCLVRFTGKTSSVWDCRSVQEGCRSVQPWVEGVAEAVADEVDGEHGDKDHEPRREPEPRHGTQDTHGLGVRQQVPPACGRRLYTHPQETEGGLLDDGLCRP